MDENGIDNVLDSILDSDNNAGAPIGGTDTFIGDEAGCAEVSSAAESAPSLFERCLEDIPEDNPETEDDVTSDYKEKMKQLKADYKKRKKKAKENRLNSERMFATDPTDGTRIEYIPAKPHTLLTIVVSSAVTLLICGIVFALLLVVPNTKNSYFAHLCKKYSKTAADRYYTQPSQQIGDNTIEPGSTIKIEVDGESSVAAVYAKAANSVVGVEVRALSGQKWETVTETVTGQGSGVVLSEDGQILTNYHVISAAMDTSTHSINSSYKIIVYLDTKLSHGFTVTNVIGYDESCDIAILKIDAEGLTPIEFGDSDALSLGETVIAIGSPGGLEFMNSVSAGIVSGLRRNITSSSTGNTIYDLIQTTAAINPGNSGGALLNSKGELVGICVIKIVDDSFEGMGFAISSNTAKMIAESILKYGKYVKALIGVTVNTAYNYEAAERKGWPAGAYIEEVNKGGAADKAGIKAEDIICELNGTRVETFDDLRRLLSHYSPDDSITLTIYRPASDEYIDVTVVLSAS